MIEEWQSLIKRMAKAQQRKLEALQEEERKAREAEEREQQRQIDELLQQAEQLREAHAIRAYAIEVEQSVVRSNLADSALAAWATWARGEADRIDPTKNGTAVETIHARSHS